MTATHEPKASAPPNGRPRSSAYYNQSRLLAFYFNEVSPRLARTAVWQKLVDKGQGRLGGHPCPKCKRPETYTYADQQYLHCGHMNSCGYSESILEALSGSYRPDGSHLVEAIKLAASLAAIPMDMEPLTPEEQHQARDWHSRQAVLEAAVLWCHQQLMAEDEHAADVRDHLLSRGVDHAGATTLQLGLIPLRTGTMALRKHLEDKGLAPQAISRSGVTKQNLSGYILFPWRDEHGSMLTIAGRWPGDPPTPSQHPGDWGDKESIPKIYSLPGGAMSSPLYLDRAIRAREKTLVCVEGLFDSAVAQISGDRRVVATGTNHVHAEQAETIGRYHSLEAVILSPDSDSAGQEHIGKSISNLTAARALRIYVAPKLAPRENGHKVDPDEIIREQGIEAWKRHVEGAIPSAVYQAEQILSGVTKDSPAQQKDHAHDEIIKLILGLDDLPDKQVDSMDERRVIALASPALNIPAGILDKELKKLRTKAVASVRVNGHRGAQRKPKPDGRMPSDARGPDRVYDLSDVGNGQRLVYYHGKDIRYSHEWKKWLVWDGMRWAFDRVAEVYRYAKDTQIRIFQEPPLVKGSSKEADAERTAIAKHASRSASMRAIDAMIKMASSEPTIPVLIQDLDRDPWLLNVRNGTVDLRTGGISDHKRESMLTKLCPVDYDPTAACPTWIAFLDRIMAGNQHLISFLQRAAGYSLTARFTEKALFIPFGGGDNGKSTFLNTIREMLGDYACQAAPDLLVVKKNDSHPTELADLMGMRFVTSIETEKGKRLAESLVKWLTGGDKIKARHMREDFVEFDPTFKLWLATNHKPRIKNTDQAMWVRIKLIPFEVHIPEAEQDKNLPDKFRDERPGILRWAIDGCTQWREEGLGLPQEITAAIQAYKGEMDVTGPFVEKCCKLGPTLKISAAELHSAFSSWCQETGEFAYGKKEFNQRLCERFGVSTYPGTKGKVTWRGIDLDPEKGDAWGISRITQNTSNSQPTQKPGRASYYQSTIPQDK